MEKQSQPTTVFRLGITMAGAVSAGAYTAGVLDYLFETLHLWEKKRAEDPNSVLPHKVIIEVMAGASAGSLCTALSLLALRDSETLDQCGQKRSVLYKAWVEMNHNNPRYTDMLDQMLKDRAVGNITALLNTVAIDNLSKQILTDHFENVDPQLPAYVCDHVEIIMTLSSLKGVKFRLGFGDKKINTSIDDSKLPTTDRNPEISKKREHSHVMQLHKGVAHYVVDRPNEEVSRLKLTLSSPTEYNDLIKVAKGSGAFPVGLRHRWIDNIPGEYIEWYVKNLYKDLGNSISVDHIEEKFATAVVDGGAFNNEPIEFVEERLNDVCTRIKNVNQPAQIDNKSAHILIDPFPNIEEQEESTYERPETFMAIIGQLLSAFMHQVRVKEPSALATFRNPDGTNKRHRGMILPSRRSKEGDIVEYDLATGGLGGFAGFLSRDFREYDYCLGRTDCASFLKHYFTIPTDADTLAQYECYKEVQVHTLVKDNFAHQNPRHDHKWEMPIIPDLRTEEQKKYGLNEFNEEDFPALTKKELRKRKPAIRKRLHRLVSNVIMGQIAGITNLSTKSIAYLLLFLTILASIYFLAVRSWSIAAIILGINALIALVLYYLGIRFGAQYLIDVVINELEPRGQIRE